MNEGFLIQLYSDYIFQGFGIHVKYPRLIKKRQLVRVMKTYVVETTW